MADGTMPEKMGVDIDAILQTEQDKFDFEIATAILAIEHAKEIGKAEEEVGLVLDKLLLVLSKVSGFRIRER